MMNAKPTIYWLLQENHVSPTIIDFLKLFKNGATNINLQFLIPQMWDKTIEQCQDLNPVPIKAIIHQQESFDWFQRKRNSISDVCFKEGLPAWRTLILDDLNAGNAYPVIPEIPEDPTLQFIIAQIPTPLGSLENEERAFYAFMHWAHVKRIPFIGYELLPLDTKWSLIPSLLDGTITTRRRSYEHLTSPRTAIKSKVWLVPRYERKIFSAVPGQLWRNGVGVPYRLKEMFNIAPETTILFIPHNVALSMEYKRLIQFLTRFGEKLHIMFSIGKDQVRGTHRHQEIVEILSGDDLKKFASISFHDISATLDIMLADAVVSCASCHATAIAANNSIPSIIMDTDMPDYSDGTITNVHTYAELEKTIKKTIEHHSVESSFSQIFSSILRTTLSRTKS